MEKHTKYFKGKSYKSLFAEPLFLVPSWQQQFDMLGHLCLQSQNILVLLGEKDAGKTSFIKLLQDYKLAGIKKITINGKILNSPDRLSKAIADGFRLSWPISGELTSDLLYYGTDDEGSLTKVIIIDDAHTLNDAVLQALLHLINFKQPVKEQLHIILFGEPALEETLRQPEHEIVMKDNIQCMNLAAWKDQDVQFLLNEKGIKYSDRLIQALLQKSYGHPKIIIKRIGAIPELETVTKYPIMDMPWIKKILDRPVALGVSFGFVLGISILLFNLNNSTETTITQKNESIALPGQSTNIAYEETLNVAPKTEFPVSQPIDQNPEQLTTLEEVFSSQETLPTYDKPNTVPIPLQEEKIEMAIVPEPTSTFTKREVTKPIQVAKAPVHTVAPKQEPVASSPAQTNTKSNVTAEKNTKETKPAQVKSTNKIPAEPKKIAKVTKEPAKIEIKKVADKKTATPNKVAMTKSASKTATDPNPNLYTIQLVASSTQANADKFIRDNHLQKDAKVVRIASNGKDLYVVLYGTYPSQEKAQKVAQTLKASKLTPWVRQYASVQSKTKRG